MVCARREVIADRSLILDAFLETVRFDMPTQFMARVAKRDVEIRGHKIHEGQPVLLLYTSASRDAAEILSAMPDYTVDLAASERVYTEFVQGFASLPIEFEPY